MPITKAQQKKALAITGLIIFVTFYLALKLVYQPQQSKKTQLGAEIKKETEKNSLIKEIISGQNQMNNYQKQFSPQPDTVWLEDKLGQLAKSLKIEQLKITPKTSFQTYEPAPLTVEVRFKGTYQEMVKFLSKIEKSPEFMEVKKINIVSLSAETLDRLISSSAVNPKINRADWENLLNQNQESQIILEVNTFYVQ